MHKDLQWQEAAALTRKARSELTLENRAEFVREQARALKRPQYFIEDLLRREGVLPLHPHEVHAAKNEEKRVASARREEEMRQLARDVKARAAAPPTLTYTPSAGEQLDRSLWPVKAVLWFFLLATLAAAIGSIFS